MEQPPIELFGVKILEPVTTFTDLIVAAVCFYAFFKMIQKQRKEKVFVFLKYYFLTMGIATTFGGLIGHGFLYYFSFAWKLPGWITSMLSIMLVERASIEHTRPLITTKTANAFRIINTIELLTFMAITMITLNFRFVEIHSGYGLMVVVLSLQLFTYLKTRNTGSGYFLIGVFFAAVSALFYMNEIALHTYLNHYDISHLFMAVAAWFFYVGTKNLEIINPERDQVRSLKEIFSFNN
jgi:hypothetical protein